MSLLNQLTSIVDKSKKRVGRGYGSGKGGHTSGRGAKGQKAGRSGAKVPIWFEGGQLPLIRRLPKWPGKGRFKSLEPSAELTLTDLEKMNSEVISLETLKKEKVIDVRFKKAKIIKTGQLKRAVTVKGVPVSAGAKKEIENAGGSVE